MGLKELAAISGYIPSNVSEGRTKAEKSSRGGWKLFWRGTDNEIFPGELFQSAAEAKRTFIAVREFIKQQSNSSKERSSREHMKITRTSEQQAERKYEGDEVQNIVKGDLEQYITKMGIVRKINVYPSEGIDIKVKNGETINIEVKSARQWERDLDKKRRGRFWIKPDDFRADYFAFVVKPVNEQFQWDRSEPVTIHYIQTKKLVEYLKSKPKYQFEKQRVNFKISINEMLRLPRIDKIPI